MSCTNIDPISVLILQSKNFWEYRDAATKAQELAAGGKKEELQCFCVDEVILLDINQVERLSFSFMHSIRQIN